MDITPEQLIRTVMTRRLGEARTVEQINEDCMTCCLVLAAHTSNPAMAAALLMIAGYPAERVAA